LLSIDGKEKGCVAGLLIIIQTNKDNKEFIRVKFERYGEV